MPGYFAPRREVLQAHGSFPDCGLRIARVKMRRLARRERVDSQVPQQDETEERLRPLMIRSLEGDSGAHRQLLGVLGRYLRGYFARRIGTGTAEVEDLVQETLLAVHLKRDSYDRSLPFTPWAYALARYKLIDHLRRRSRSIQVPLEDAGALFAADGAEEGALRIDLDRLLQRLPDRQRSLIEDVKLQGLSVEEAARKRGVTAVSARVMLHRSLKWLNQVLRDENG
jgi:RNA polymerase sigma-70 factor (ECF subfamily)